MEKNKKLIIAGIILAILVVGILFFNFSKSESTQSSESVLENEPTIGPVDKSVIVDLKSAQKKGEIVINIKNAPSGTKVANIELTYNRERRPEDETVEEVIPDGALASCEFKGGSRNCVKEGITLGTCSSGVCRYHTVVGKIKLSILFSGTYGDRIFEKEYSL